MAGPGGGLCAAGAVPGDGGTAGADRHYVEAQVHYANGETARYNSAAGLWNNAFLTYRDYRARTAVPEGGASALRLC